LINAVGYTGMLPRMVDICCCSTRYGNVRGGG